jgi:Fe2+ transport system protein FeoA
MAPSVLALTSLAAGQSASVAELRLPADTRARLQELGLVSGTVVQLVRFAPLGDPVEIHVRGSNLSLRRHEAEQILVEAAR